MALPNPLPAVQGARIALGPGIWEDTYVIAPGTSDYVNTGTIGTSGYIISALSLRLNPTYGIMSAWVSGNNGAAAGYVPQVYLNIAQIGAVVGGAGFEGYSQLNFQVFGQPSALTQYAALTQQQSGGNFSGCVWLLTVRGQ
jgi:hypothetical protein